MEKEGGTGQNGGLGHDGGGTGVVYGESNVHRTAAGMPLRFP